MISDPFIKAGQHADKTLAPGRGPSMSEHLCDAGNQLDQAQTIFRQKISATGNMSLPAMRAFFALMEATKALLEAVKYLNREDDLIPIREGEPIALSDLDRVWEALSQPDNEEKHVVLTGGQWMALLQDIEWLTAQRDKLLAVVEQAARVTETDQFKAHIVAGPIRGMKWEGERLPDFRAAVTECEEKTDA